MKKPKLIIAAAKGYLYGEAIKCLEKAGIEFPKEAADDRKLFTTDKSGQYRLLQVRPWDVSAYIAQGCADLGVVGEDVLIEKEEKVVRLLDLKFGACDLVLAGLEKIKPSALTHNLKVATKYPKATEAYFKNKGLRVQIIKLYGAVELAPITGLADLITDLTVTGQTLAANGLTIIDTVFKSTARLVANPISMRQHYSVIKDLTQKLAVK